jgi:hypothetical protein
MESSVFMERAMGIEHSISLCRTQFWKEVIAAMMKVYVNATRNACRHPDERVRRSEARRTIKLFLVPCGTSMSDGMVPDHLVSDAMIDRFLEIEPPVLRCTTKFDVIIEEVERLYVLGLFFASVSTSVVTIERILNTARIQLHRLASPKIKELLNKSATTDWQPNINALVTWGYGERVRPAQTGAKSVAGKARGVGRFASELRG